MLFAEQCIHAGGTLSEQQSIEQYIARVVTKGAVWSGNDARTMPSVLHASACLTQTHARLDLEYPIDADAHFEHMRKTMAPWAQHATHKMGSYLKFDGPWLENTWISTFEAMYDLRERGQTLQDFFGPYVPIFIPFNDHWMRNGGRFPALMSSALKRVIRPKVPYIVVSNNARGIAGIDTWWSPARYPNVLVMSAGGYGHVPLPLFLRDQNVYSRQLKKRELLVSYVGSSGNAPGRMRLKAISCLRAMSQRFNFSTFIGHLPSWRDVMANSRVSLCPRGFGRTSFHLVETLQMGLIPVHVYIDREWLPYSKLYHTFAFACNVQGLPRVLETILNMRIVELESREAIVRNLTISHFSQAGTMKHIAGFMQQTGSDLECGPLPNSVLADPHFI